MPTTTLLEDDERVRVVEESYAAMDLDLASDDVGEDLQLSPKEERIRGGGKVTGARGRDSRRHQPYRNNAAVAATGGGGNNNTNRGFKKVFVGNLSYNVSWQDLKDYMRSAGDVVHAEVMAESNGRSKGCGIVEYATPEGAQQAVLTLNETQLDGRQIFVREDREDKNVSVGPAFTYTISNSGVAAASHGHHHGQSFAPPPPHSQSRRVYVGNLSYSVSWQDLKDHFRQCGNVLHASIICESNGRSKGCGLVEFSDPKDALEAISTLNETNLQGRMIFVREDRETATSSSSPAGGFQGQQHSDTNTTSVFVSNLSYSTSWQALKDHMRKAGNVDQATILSQGGSSKGCAIVVYQRPQEAARAIRELQNSELDGRSISIREDRNQAVAAGGQGPRSNERGRAGPERNHGGRGGHAGQQRQGSSGGGVVGAGCQLFVNNLAPVTTWRELKDLFRQCGDVERADVMTNAEGRSKGFGTVRFFDERDAQDAIDRLNGEELQGHVLQVRLDTKVN